MGLLPSCSCTCFTVCFFICYVCFAAVNMVNVVKPGGLAGFTMFDDKGNKFPTFSPHWKEGESVHAVVFLSTKPNLPNRPPRSSKRTIKVWEAADITWDWQSEEGWKHSFNISASTVPKTIWKKIMKGSAYVHAYVSRSNKRHDFSSADTVVSNTMMVEDRVIPRVVRVLRQRLLYDILGDCGCNAPGNDAPEYQGDDPESLPPAIPMPHWKPNASFRMVVDSTEYPQHQVPQTVAMHLHLVHAGRERPTKYKPVLFHDDMLVTADQLIPINDTVTELPLTISISPSSIARWQLAVVMEQSFKLMTSSLGAEAKDTDDMKRMITDTNPIFLVCVMLISVLHMLFDVLAFKSDIQFWNNLKSMEGLSARAQLGSLICQIVILLYLHHEESSKLVLVPAFVGVIIQVWKVVRVAKTGWSQTKTSEYDRMAYGHLGSALYPLVIGFALHSLLCNAYEGWYSWGLNAAVKAVYTFGFITMTPQLFINYKLQSVAHLPWRFLIYRTLNTFIDDMFAFVIRMPTMHRLSCFRDDIVFFIYVYQRYAYRVDMSRPAIGVDLDSKESNEEAEAEAASDEAEAEAVSDEAEAKTASDEGDQDVSTPDSVKKNQ